MNTSTRTIIVKVTIGRPVTNTWQCWVNPMDIEQWNVPFENWRSSVIENDVRPAGHFLFRMEAKDGSEGFDHGGRYDNVIVHQLIEYTLSDGRKSRIEFFPTGASTMVVESFEPEKENPIDMQRDFYQSVLLNFKRHVEQKSVL